MPPTDVHPLNATVVVIGAGQAGLSAGYHLQRRGFVDATAEPDAPRTYIILDADASPGGAWQHRWESLTMSTVNHIFDLPDFPAAEVDPNEPSRTAVPRYFADFETQHNLAILRPVRVTSVRRNRTQTDMLLVDTAQGTWHTRFVINATGTWNNPVLPIYPGAELFTGPQLHSRDYSQLQDFAGQRVGIIGGGISAVQQLEEISRVAATFWYTRTKPIFREDDFRPENEGREVIEKVTADVEAGRSTGSVVSYTGLVWSPYARAAQARGALLRRPMFTAIEPNGVREADGSLTELDVILWATGYKAALAHLGPLGLRNEDGGIMMNRTQVAAEPRVHLIGFGPSQSTVGANRAGRDAVRTISRTIRSSPPTPRNG